MNRPAKICLRASNMSMLKATAVMAKFLMALSLARRVPMEISGAMVHTVLVPGSVHEKPAIHLMTDQAMVPMPTKRTRTTG